MKAFVYSNSREPHTRLTRVEVGERVDGDADLPAHDGHLCAAYVDERREDGDRGHRRGDVDDQQTGDAQVVLDVHAALKVDQACEQKNV